MAIEDSYIFPEKGERNPSGMLNVRATEEDWDIIIRLKHHWESERKQFLKITDIVRACIRLAASTLPDVPDGGKPDQTTEASAPRPRRKR